MPSQQQTRPQPSRRDRLRQLGVTLGALVFAAGAVSGSGLLDLPDVADAAGGRLSSTATLLAPASQAFIIWSLIYLMLIGYTVQQWRPHQAVRAAHRNTGWWAAAAMALAGSWIFVSQVAGWLWVGAVIMLALSLSLGVLVRELRRLRDLTTGDLIWLDSTFGLFLGWASVATVAHITTTLVGAGVDPHGWLATFAAVAVLAVVAALGTWFVVTLGDRVAVALAMAWGLGWIAAGRLAGEPRNLLVGIVAAVVALYIVAFTLTWPRRHPRRDATDNRLDTAAAPPD